MVRTAKTSKFSIAPTGPKAVRNVAFWARKKEQEDRTQASCKLAKPSQLPGSSATKNRQQQIRFNKGGWRTASHNGTDSENKQTQQHCQQGARKIMNEHGKETCVSKLFCFGVFSGGRRGCGVFTSFLSFHFVSPSVAILLPFRCRLADCIWCGLRWSGWPDCQGRERLRALMEMLRKPRDCAQ